MTPTEAFALVMSFFAILGLGVWIAKWDSDRWDRKHPKKWPSGHGRFYFSDLRRFHDRDSDG